ncbi:hypothetical protein [Halostella litorea]|uniref:hypothetical protein n=1 Tax=Halostella litorea TaxID=2528831 RepID=UPI001091D6FD|nr:hypothetical protein [Halostella litorea]
MVTRYDAVLAAIPAVAVTGVVLHAGVRALDSTVGLTGSPAQYPLWIGGFLAALALIAHEMVTFPVEE